MNENFARQVKTMLATAAVFTLIIQPCQSRVLPGQANPKGTSIDDMTFSLAKFQDTFDQSFLPNTPFQIVFQQDFDPSTGIGTGNFTVKPGTFFFVPVFSFNDSPPIIGDFPTNSSEVVNYIFGPDQIGLQSAQITVDRQSFNLGPANVSGLVNTPSLPNGGSHTILMGAFVTPLPKGTHTITISASFDGAQIGTFEFENIYTVTVR